MYTKHSFGIFSVDLQVKWMANFLHEIKKKLGYMYHMYDCKTPLHVTHLLFSLIPGIVAMHMLVVRATCAPSAIYFISVK